MPAFTQEDLEKLVTKASLNSDVMVVKLPYIQYVGFNKSVSYNVECRNPLDDSRRLVLEFADLCNGIGFTTARTISGCLPNRFVSQDGKTDIMITSLRTDKLNFHIRYFV